MQKRLVLLLVKGDIITYGLKLYLEQWGFEVREHSDSKLSMQEVLDQHPVLIVLDLSKCLTPTTLTFELLSESHSVPLLLLATDSAILQHHYIRLQKQHHYDAIPKPCLIAELKRAVEGLVGASLPVLPRMETSPEVITPPTEWKEA